MLIAFEGMDGCGKSSISTRVAKNLGMRHETQKIMTMLDINNEQYENFVRTIRSSHNQKLSLMFYTFRCMLDKDSKEDIIVERSMISTYFYEHNKVSSEEFNFLMSLDNIPDITFILYASSDERRRRIFYRNAQDEDLNSMEALSDGYKDMLECAHKYNIPYIGINSEKYEPDEIIDICSRIILKLKNLNETERIEFIEEMNNEYGFDSLYKERMLTLNE